MLSEVALCNMALSHLGQTRFISSLDEPSTEGKQCALFYAQTRDSLLADYPWRFASQVSALALRNEEPLSHWKYAYAFPASALRVQRLLPSPSDEDDTDYYSELRRAVYASRTIPFEVQRTESGKSILTNLELAQALCTMQITDPLEFPAKWAETLTWALAMALSAPLTGNTSKRDECIQYYSNAWSLAIQEDANSGTDYIPSYVPDYIAVR